MAIFPSECMPVKCRAALKCNPKQVFAIIPCPAGSPSAPDLLTHSPNPPQISRHCRVSRQGPLCACGRLRPPHPRPRLTRSLGSCASAERSPVGEPAALLGGRHLHLHRGGQVSPADAAAGCEVREMCQFRQNSRPLLSFRRGGKWGIRVFAPALMGEWATGVDGGMG